MAQAIDDEEVAGEDGDAVLEEEPVFKPSAVMEVRAVPLSLSCFCLTHFPQALKFGWNSVFTPDSSVNGACNVSPQAVEALIDRTRGIAGSSAQTADASEPNRSLFEEQQCSVASFNIEQPLVSTHLLNGERLDDSAHEDNVQAIAASWNQSRFASRVADAMPIYARCFAALFSLFIAGLFGLPTSRKPMQNSWSHDDACMACGDGGELLLCDLCPAAYHLECIGAGQV